MPTDAAMDADVYPPECTANYAAVQHSKYEMCLLHDEDDLEEQPLDLKDLEPTPENFAAVVAECNRLRNDNRRLQATLFNLDSHMDEVVNNCEKVVAESNFRFKKAINSLMHMDTSLRALKKESSKQARHLADVTSERNILRRQLDSALNELKNLKTCSLSWVRGGNKVARVQEGLTTPRRM